nr:uncharacterized protein LOC123763528 [Procambarus clarkii]
MRGVQLAEAAVVLATATVLAAAVKDDPILPDIWTVVEGSYDSDVTVNFPDLEPGATMNVYELYEIKEEKGMLNIVDHGHSTRTNYYGKTDQTFVVRDHQCAVGTILENDGYRLWGWIYDASSSAGGKANFLYGPSALLRIVRDYKDQVEYKGQDKIRGISADHWLINHKDNYTLDYYFASGAWLMPFGHSMDGLPLAAPLLVKVHGKQGDPWNPSMNDFDQSIYYEYTDFRPYIVNGKKHEFLVEDGVDCKGRETLDPHKSHPPKAPETFEVFIETVVRNYNPTLHQSTTTVFRAWMYYDNWRQLLRIDINPDMDADENTQAYKSIHDFNTGIQYKIDLETGTCKMGVLDPDELGNVIGSSAIAGVIMADPNNLFHLDDTYFFNGYGETRGLRTTRWTSTRKDLRNPDTGNNFNKAVVDYQFTSEETEIHGEWNGTSFPASIDVTVYNDSDPEAILYRHTVNLLHFKSYFEVFEINPFDVRDCMDIPSQRTWVKITFDGDWFHGASQGPDLFKKILIDKIAGDTQSSFIRFPEVQMDHDIDHVFATMLLLEPAPYHLQFQQLDDRKPTDSDTQLELVVDDVDICAFRCLRNVKFICQSFYECTDLERNCYVSNYKDSPGKFVDIPKECAHYNKVLLKNDTMVQKPNEEIVLWLKGEIEIRNFAVRVDYVDSDGQTKVGVYTAVHSEEVLMADDPVLVELVRDDFRTAYVKGKLKVEYTDLQLSKVSYAKCLASCLQQKAFECEAFSYCYNDMSCYLSSYVVDTPAPESDVIGKTDCVVISRNHLHDYSKMDGTVYLGTPKATMHTLGPGKCAYLCDNSTTFTCRSFDFCRSDDSCNLFDEHSIDVPDNMLNHSYDQCVHYTRDALVDFVEHENQVLSGNRDRYIKAVTTSRCAQVCEDEPDFGCNGFDYCVESGDITCFLTSAHYSDSGVIITNSPTCDHYSREYYEGDDRDSHANKRKNSSKYIYGPGDMAGLACSMLVISIGLTFAGVYVYNKYYKK